MARPNSYEAMTLTRVPHIEMTGADLTMSSGGMDGWVRDEKGNDITAQFLIRTWIAASDLAAPAAQTDFSVGLSGTEIRERTANADYDVLTTSAGYFLMAIQLAGAGTIYVMAELDGRVYSQSVAIT